MTDEQAVQLLTLLRDYFRHYGEDAGSPRKVTVTELARDLVESLPYRLEPKGIESVLFPISNASAR